MEAGGNPLLEQRIFCPPNQKQRGAARGLARFFFAAGHFQPLTEGERKDGPALEQPMKPPSCVENGYTNKGPGAEHA